jgi:hypothetical protein
VLINRRLAVGYRDSLARELFVEVYKRGSGEVVSQKALLTNVIFRPLTIMYGLRLENL